MDITSNTQPPQIPPIGFPNQELPQVNKNQSANLIVIGAIFFLCVLGISSFLIANKKKQESHQTTSVSPSIAVSHTASMSTDIHNSLLVYENNGVFLLDRLDSKPVTLTKDGEGPSYSAILGKIAYVDSSIKQDNAVFIYDIPTQKTEEVTDIKSDGTLHAVFWSPDGKYLVTESNTSVIGTLTVYAYPSNKKITSFRTYGALPEIQWDSEGNLIFHDPEDVTPPRQYESGQGQGIAKIFLPSGEKKILLQANAQYDYILLSISHDTIYYLQLDPNNVEEYNKQFESPTKCWSMTANVHDKKSVDCKSIPSQQINNLVSAQLPAVLAGYSVIECLPNSKNPDWFLCSFYNKNASNASEKIGLFDRKDPQKGITTILDGHNPSW